MGRANQHQIKRGLRTRIWCLTTNLVICELDGVLRLLDGSKVPVILLKGAALAKGVYEKVGLRGLVRKKCLSLKDLLIEFWKYPIGAKGFVL